VSKIYFSNLIFISQRSAVRGLKYFGLFGLVLFSFTLALPVQASGLIGSEDQIIKLTNQIRIVRGIPTLTQNALLGESAQNKAEDMAANGYFSHADQNGNRMAYWMNLVGYDYLRAGENLAKGFDTPEVAVQAWINSPTHYMNLVNDNYTEIGVGMARGIINGKTTIVVVQHFGQPMPKLTTPALVAGLVLGETVVSGMGMSVSLPPSTGGGLTTNELVINDNVSDSAVTNVAPKGLLFIAYEELENANTEIAQMWDNLQNDFPVVPYASDLPRTGYQFIQTLIVLGWFAGAIWLGYQLILPIFAWFHQKPRLNRKY